MTAPEFTHALKTAFIAGCEAPSHLTKEDAFTFWLEDQGDNLLGGQFGITPADLDKNMTAKQRHFVNTIATLVNYVLDPWPRGSGKTIARRMLAFRIMNDDA